MSAYCFIKSVNSCCTKLANSFTLLADSFTKLANSFTKLALLSWPIALLCLTIVKCLTLSFITSVLLFGSSHHL